MASILIVCTANICRSPVVEGVLRDRLKNQGLNNWQVKSAGTWAVGGQRAAPYSVEILAEKGLDIRNHSSRIVDPSILNDSDLVLCMERGHVEALRVEFPDDAFKIFLLSEMSGPGYSVPDPYGGSRQDYEIMVRDVTEMVDHGLPKIIRMARANERRRIESGQ